MATLSEVVDLMTALEAKIAKDGEAEANAFKEFKEYFE